MNQKETKARDAFRSRAEGKINIELIENQQSSSTPDAICINRRGSVFWLEFKALDKWPVKAATCPLKNSFERGQIPKLKEWVSWNGLAFVLLKVSDEFYLLHPKSDVDLTMMTQENISIFCVASGLGNVVTYLENIQ